MFKDAHCLIVEDNPETRIWLDACVKSAFDSIRTHCSENFTNAKNLISETDFQLALIDLGLPDGNGLDLIAEFKQSRSDCYIVVATIYDDDKNLFAALRQGAKGYILKDQDKDRIVSYLQGIQYNRPAISDASSQRLIDHFNQKGVELDSSGLTAREVEVTRLVAKGYSVDETAKLLKLSPETVKGYVKNIYSKLGVNNRSEITLKAISLGLIDT